MNGNSWSRRSPSPLGRALVLSISSIVVVQALGQQPAFVRAACPQASPAASASPGPSASTGPGAGPVINSPTSNTIVGYQSSGYRYRVVSRGGGSGLEASSYDDSCWGTGSAAFGSGGGCPLESTVATAWSANTDVLVRRHISFSAGTTGLTVGIAVDNDVQAFWNGTLIGTDSHEFCPSLDSFTYAVPDNLLIPGDNVPAVRGIDRGDQSLLDITVRGTLPSGVTTQTAPPAVIDREHNGTSRDPVGTFSGDFRYSCTDLAICGRGPAPTFTRSYDGADTRVGPLGPGWTDNYATRPRSPGDGSGALFLVAADGNTDRYTHNPDSMGSLGDDQAAGEFGPTSVRCAWRS
jgi:Domain of unknown function (DUF6531)